MPLQADNTDTKKLNKHRIIGFTAGLFAVCALAVCLSYYWRVAYSPQYFGSITITLGTVATAVIIYLLAVLICVTCRDKEYIKTALLIFLAGLVFVFAGGPMQVPDEPSHFLRCYAMSKGNFAFDGTKQYTGDIAALVNAFPGAYMNGYKNSIAAAFQNYSELVTAGTAYINEPQNFQILPYIPQAIMIFIARLLGFGALGQMYAARIGGLLLYTAICYFALKNCDRYRSVMLGVMLLPISLYIAASPSYDGLLLSASYFVFSYFCKEKITMRDLPWLLAAASVCAIKLPQLMLLVVLLLIPKEHWDVKTKKGKRISPWAVLLMCFAATAAVYIIMSVYTAFAKSGFDVITRWNPDVSIQGQLVYIVKNFPAFIARLLFSLYENNLYLTGLGSFGSLDINIMMVTLLSLFSLFCAVVLGVQKHNADRKTTAIGLVIFGVCYVGAMMSAMYITWTPVSMIRVIGVQVRYFLPCLPALMAAGSWLMDKALTPRIENAAKVKTAAFWIPFAVAVISGVLLFQHSYIGPFARAATTIFG